MDPLDIDVSEFDEPAAKPSPSAGQHAKAAFEGAADTASLGFVDEGTGGVVAALENTGFGRWVAEKLGLAWRDDDGRLHGASGVIEDNGKPQATWKTSYQAGRDSKRQDVADAAAASPKAFKAGQVAGAVAQTVVAPVAATRLGRAGATLAEGAVRGLGGSEADLTEGDVVQAAKDAVIGAAVAAPAAALGAIAKPAARTGGKPLPVPAAAKPAAKEGVGSTAAAAVKGAVVGYAADEVLKKFGAETGIPLPVIAAALAVARKSGKGGGLGSDTYKRFAAMAKGKITPAMVETMTKTMPEAATRAFYGELSKAAGEATGMKAEDPLDVDVSEFL